MWPYIAAVLITLALVGIALRLLWPVERDDEDGWS